MKKHLNISIIVFILISALGLAANFIRWDETPLEQSIYAIPLFIGFMLEMPFLRIMGLLISDTQTEPINYTLIWSIIPFVTGMFYAAFYYLIVWQSKKLFLDRSRERIIRQ